MLSLYSEIIAYLFAASLLGLFVGWMMQRSRAKRRLAGTIEAWKEKHSKLEASTKEDTEHLELQLQSLASDMKALQASNRTLTDNIRKNDSSLQKARADSIELNRQHAETQERLQRIIQQKDRALAELGNRTHEQLFLANPTAPTQPLSLASRSIGPHQTDTEYVQNNATKTDFDQEDTVAIDHTTLATDSFDATVRLDPDQIYDRSSTDRIQQSNEPEESSLDSTLESTADLNDATIDDLEESTVALDEETIRYVQKSSQSHRRD